MCVKNLNNQFFWFVKRLLISSSFGSFSDQKRYQNQKEKGKNSASIVLFAQWNTNDQLNWKWLRWRYWIYGFHSLLNCSASVWTRMTSFNFVLFSDWIFQNWRKHLKSEMVRKTMRRCQFITRTFLDSWIDQQEHFVNTLPDRTVSGTILDNWIQYSIRDIIPKTMPDITLFSGHPPVLQNIWYS
jgi:hypothetical protein